MERIFSQHTPRLPSLLYDFSALEQLWFCLCMVINNHLWKEEIQ